MNPAQSYIIHQPEPYRSILVQLSAIIESVLPEVQLKFKWSIPYYYLQGKPFCFLNASHKRRYVDLAFNKGFQLQQYQELLVAGGGRKTFKSLRYSDQNSIDDQVLVAVILEAAEYYKK